VANNTEGQEVPVTPVSSKSIIALASTFVVTLGAIAVAYYTNRPNDADRFYGYQGRSLQQQVAEYGSTTDELQEHVSEIQHKLDLVDGINMRCSIRQDKTETTLDILRDKVHEFQARKNQLDETQDLMIKDCIRRTRL